MPELVSPSSRYQQSFIEAVREVQASGSGLGDTLKWDVAGMEVDFDRVLAELRRYEPGHELPEGFVHSESLWLVEGETYLGRASLRHTLNASLREFGGHIGYEVRPSARRQGHGKTILRLTLGRARELGLKRVLISCDTDNLGSRGVIEGNGGVLEGEFVLDYHPKPLRRYWITL